MDDALQSDSKKMIEDQLQELPLLPVVVMKMMTLNRDDDNYFEEITQLAGQDPTFAVRLIRMANSSALASRVPITNLKSAIVRLGTSQIATLVTSIAVMRIFVPSSAEARDLWLHSIQTAIAARAIAMMGETREVNPDDAYMAGLLHDIGRFILLGTAIGELKQIDENDWACPQQLIELEQKLCGFDHTQLGWRICSRWGLPEQIVEVIRAHHLMDLSGNNTRQAPLKNLVRITRLADSFSMAALHASNHRDAQADIDQAIDTKCTPLLAHDPYVTLEGLQATAPAVIAESERQFAMLGLPSA
ncbi:MAG: HDOD domain-containing protein [Gammaproteobacteria bacterium]